MRPIMGMIHAIKLVVVLDRYAERSAAGLPGMIEEVGEGAMVLAIVEARKEDEREEGDEEIVGIVYTACPTSCKR